MSALAARAALLLVLFGAAQGCSSKSVPPANDAGGAGGGAGSTGGAGGGGVTYVGGCAAILSANAGACDTAGRRCTYGDAPRGECRDSATCVGGVWAVRAGACPPPSPAALCPPAAPAAGASCGTAQQLCAYPGGMECLCLGATIGWVCDVPRNTGGDCPAASPNAGTACSGTTSCTYLCGLLTSSYLLARCVDGVWRWDLVPCGNTNRGQ